jgi:hypothetical protein
MRRSGRGGRLWLAGAALCAALVCGELGLRAVGFSAPEWTQPDTDLGWTLRPELREVNLHGLRDREHLLAKPADVYRIAVLGDDYSEARGLPLDQTWWRRLERALNVCDLRPGQRVEVLNFGIGGFGTAQQYIQLQTEVIRYQPDLVLLQFNGADDVRNNSFLLEPEKERPFFMLDAKGTLVIDDSFASAPAFRTRASFRHQLLRKVSDRARVVQLVRALHEVPFIPQARAVQSPENSPLWEEAWRVTEALVAASHDFAGRNGSKLALVVVPGPEPRLEAFAARQGIATFPAKPEHQATAISVADRLCAAK